MIAALAQANPMLLKVSTLWPEIVLTATAFLVMIVGLSPARAVRRSTPWLAAAALIVAAVLAAFGDLWGLPAVTPLSMFVKMAVCSVGLLLLLIAVEVPNEWGTEPEHRKTFDPSDTSRGEFFGFFLLSLVGVMLCAGADDLIWLFLALELTSLPTYVMVATSRQRIEAQEAGVKYFFLGAMSAAVFLYGFALIYGATGATTFNEIQIVLARDGMGNMAMLGVVLAIVGVCFKIAAVPMHAYTADVYQGAATPVTAFLAFVPKTAGFVTLIILLNLVGWPLTDSALPLMWLLWVLAVATMFVGNTLALLQHNVKRVLAYSSIAHSGYMLVGLTAGPGTLGDSDMLLRNGLGAVLFYVVAYGVMTIGAFAVLGILKRQGEEAETFDDLRGLVRRHPMLATAMAICVFALAGLPPLIGFWGKLYLFGSAITGGFIWLAILGLINSAIAMVYYLRIVAACFLSAEPAARGQVGEAAALPWRGIGAAACAIIVVLMSLAAEPLLNLSRGAAEPYVGRSGDQQLIAGAEETQNSKSEIGPNDQTSARLTKVRARLGHSDLGH